jgi:hypothetical protein
VEDALAPEQRVQPSPVAEGPQAELHDQDGRIPRVAVADRRLAEHQRRRAVGEAETPAQVGPRGGQPAGRHQPAGGNRRPGKGGNRTGPLAVLVRRHLLSISSGQLDYRF